MSKEKIKQLAKKITEASVHYYIHSKPIVTDAVWDAWFDELKLLAPHHPVVNGHGANWSSEWKKVAHEVPMDSLNKVNIPEEFKQWAEVDCKNTEEFLGTEKLDGISVSLKYTNGKFIQGLTRGKDGVGDDITINVLRMSGVPHNIDKNFTGFVRGEVILKKSIFKEYFPDMANPRNAASGIARRTDGEDVDKLNVIAFKIEGENFKTEEESFARLKSLGFDIPNYRVVNIKQAIEMWNEYKSSTRESLDYEIDGLVFTVNDCATQYAMGSKGRGPAGAIAFKFDAAGAVTTVRDIVWQVGSTGRMTPVAVFDKVFILGSKIERSSIYNQSYIDELGIGIGSEILVIKANDVIPRIEEVITPGPNGTFKYPSKCPECNGKTEHVGEYIICTNKNECPPQLMGRVSTWIKELGVLEWGDKIIEKLYNANLVKDIPDIYNLSVEQIANLDKMGEKSAEILLAEIDKYREIPLHNLIGGLGIENVATSTVKKIVKAGYDTISKMYNLTINDVSSISGFGYIKASAFCIGLKENKDRINLILNSGVKIKEQVSGSLDKKSFCFTGSHDIGRKELHKMVEDAGGEVEKRVTKGLSYLVLNDPNSGTSKAVAAKKNGTALLSYEEFLEMVSYSSDEN